MTKLLEQAIAEARALSDVEQDALADALFAHIAGSSRPRLSAEQAADVARIRDDLHAGRTRLATDEEVSAVWRSAGFEDSSRVDTLLQVGGDSPKQRAGCGRFTHAQALSR